jgi:hypothetical protein
MYLNWKLDTSDEWVATQYVTAYRGCHLRIAYMGSHNYTAFVERRGILCTAHFRGAGSLSRAKLAAPKLANVMIQHATTHNESKGRVR